MTGAAPVPPELLKWYLAIGVDLIEGFGMTETTGFVCATPPQRIKVGFAGTTAPGVELRLAPTTRSSCAAAMCSPATGNCPPGPPTPSMRRAGCIPAIAA